MDEFNSVCGKFQLVVFGIFLFGIVLGIREFISTTIIEPLNSRANQYRRLNFDLEEYYYSETIIADANIETEES